MRVVAQNAVKVCSKSDAVIGHRRADVTEMGSLVMQLLKGQPLEEFAEKALSKLRTSEFASYDLRGDLGELMASAERLRTLCTQESSIVANALGQKNNEWRQLEEEIRRQQHCLAQTVKEYRHA